MTDPTPPLRYPPRDLGDAWVVAPSGERYWGRFGAAGLLAVDDRRGVLLQHRASWSHHGDTWGVPGGALHQHEPAVQAALREASEEAGVPIDAVRPWLTDVADREVWSYTTVVAQVVTPFEATISDPESLDLAWVPVDEVTRLPLHPGFAASWGRLRGLLAVRPVIVVDAANVVGSVPDGWWRDRPGAASRLLTRLATLATRGVPAANASAVNCSMDRSGYSRARSSSLTFSRCVRGSIHCSVARHTSRSGSTLVRMLGS